MLCLQKLVVCIHEKLVRLAIDSICRLPMGVILLLLEGLSSELNLLGLHRTQETDAETDIDTIKRVA